MRGQSAPLVGITLDSESNGSYAPEPYYALLTNYAQAVIAGGGLPVALPYAATAVEDLVASLQAVVVTGGMFDIDPRHYGAKARLDGLTLKPERTDFELQLIMEALRAHIPVLGICGGMQLMGVAVGARLHQHISAEVPDALEHMQPEQPHEAAHEVIIEDRSLMGRLLGTKRIAVNSVHHQAISDAGPVAVVSARAPDGVVEAIEVPGQRFAVGVQWHPEYLCAGEEALFRGLIIAARDFKCG